MLLLDEPTNHLDAESVAWLEQLQEFPGTVVAITHDRYFLDNAAGWILELDRGHGILTRATIPLGWKRRRSACKSSNDKRRLVRKRLRRNWNGYEPSQRRATKNRARLARFDELNSQEFQTRNETQEIYIPPGPRLGDKVLEVDGVSKAFDDRLLISELSFLCPREPSLAYRW